MRRSAINYPKQFDGDGNNFEQAGVFAPSACLISITPCGAIKIAVDHDITITAPLVLREQAAAYMGNGLGVGRGGYEAVRFPLFIYPTTQTKPPTIDYAEELMLWCCGEVLLSVSRSFFFSTFLLFYDYK